MDPVVSSNNGFCVIIKIDPTNFFIYIRPRIQIHFGFRRKVRPLIPLLVCDGIPLRGTLFPKAPSTIVLELFIRIQNEYPLIRKAIILCKCQCQVQTCRPCADDDVIVVHAHPHACRLGGEGAGGKCDVGAKTSVPGTVPQSVPQTVHTQRAAAEQSVKKRLTPPPTPPPTPAWR